MLKGYKVTHTTFKPHEYSYYDYCIRMETGRPFLWFYNSDIYKTGWSVYNEEKQNNMEYTIEDLREGRVAIDYGLNNIELLTKVLKKAFPKHTEPMGTCRYYLQRPHTETWWATESNPDDMPTQKLEDFKEHLHDERFPFQLNIDDARKIIGIACQEWQKKLLEKWNKVLITGFVQVEEDFYTEMRAACTKEQNELFDRIFGEDYIVDWKPNHAYLVNAGNGKTIRISSEIKGQFYANGNFKGNTISYKASDIIKLIGEV